MDLPPEGPFAAKNLVPTIWAAGIAIAGGMLSFHQKVRMGKARWVNVTELIGEMVVSGFVGLLTFWICKGYGVNEYLTAAAIAITGHMGSRAIFIAEQWIEQKSKSI
jgi:hypothetical protein